MKRVYSIVPRGDGFGSQYQSVMSAIAYCEYNNLIFKHVSFYKIAHNTDARKMNEFIGVKNDPEVENLQANIIEKCGYNPAVHYSKTPDIYYTDNVINKLRMYYYSTPKPQVEVNDIAIHIRRGDVTKHNIKVLPRYTENEVYKRYIKMLKSKYPGYKIHIHSEGKPRDFLDITSNEENIELHLNEDIQVTYHTLVTAKILVASKSSFSYTAAILNENEIYYIPMIHHPLQKWNILEE
jgi:hypothetical protein